jgi:hypothetical protein
MVLEAESGRYWHTHSRRRFDYITHKGLTFLDLGPTPNYATSSWQILSDHFAGANRQRILPTPPKAEVVDFCLIPRTSPTTPVPMTLLLFWLSYHLARLSH